MAIPSIQKPLLAWRINYTIHLIIDNTQIFVVCTSQTESSYFHFDIRLILKSVLMAKKKI